MPVRYLDFRDAFRRWDRLGELTEYGAVREDGRSWPLLRLSTPGPRWLLVTAGFHGEEQAGPLTLLERMGEVADHARARGVGLLVYPCVNPSGFEAATRYNASGERPNNDFMRYQDGAGSPRGELFPGESDLPWTLFDGGPQETRALRTDLAHRPAPNAALDLHQDAHLPGGWTYAYTFGNKDDFRPLVEASRAHARTAAGKRVDDVHRLSTDGDGLIEFRDGSITDWCFRRGARWTVALETTLQLPLEQCHEVNAIWLRGLIDLVAAG